MTIENIEPRYIYENRAYSAAHLAGSTKYKIKRKKLSSTKGEAHGRVKYVSYCPQVFLDKPNHAHPESDPHVTVNEGTKTASWKEFKWTVR